MIKIEELKKGTKVKHITSGNIAEIKYICEDDSTIRVNMGIINGIGIYKNKFNEFQIHSQPGPKKQIILTMTEEQFKNHIDLGERKDFITFKNVNYNKSTFSQGNDKNNEIESFEIKDVE